MALKNPHCHSNSVVMHTKNGDKSPENGSMSMSVSGDASEGR